MLYSKPEQQHPQRKSLQSMLVILAMWSMIFTAVCVFAVSLDPLFIYIPVTNQQNKCLTMDKPLEKAAVVLRLFTDIFFIGDIVYNVDIACKWLKEKGLWERDAFLSNALGIWRHSRLRILVDFFAILPIPQIIMLSFFAKARDLDTRKILNSVLLLQYLPRVYRIYLSSKEFTRTRDKLSRTHLWIKGAFNFFLYILASHVFGALWYFFSIQRETSCWHQACARNRSTSGCADIALNCYETAQSDIQLLINSCSTSPNSTIETSTDHFDFGIFKDALESGVVSSNDFPQKLAHCFWWGLRNLSSLGQNLNTSTYVWENLFAVSISIVGLLLLLYLIGNMQKCIELATTRVVEIKRKMELKEKEIEQWTLNNGIPMEMKIMDKVKDRLEEIIDVDVNVQSLLPLLPIEDRKSIKRFLCFTILQKVESFKNMDEAELKVISDRLKPQLYVEKTHIIREGEPLDQMLFITQGTVWQYETNCKTTTKHLKRGDYYGEELAKWSRTYEALSDSQCPTSTATVKSQTKVEVFVLNVNDLVNAISKGTIALTTASDCPASCKLAVKVER